MSWGERSCVYFGVEKKPCKPEGFSCNVNCIHYVWDNTTKPDSTDAKPKVTYMKITYQNRKQRRKESKPK